MIRETIVTTVDRAGAVHIAPLGIIADGDHWIVAPFRPSRTLDNLREVPHAVASHVDDVRIFAGCLTGRRDWPTVATAGPVPRLEAAIAHWELAVESVVEDEQRPRFRTRLVRAVVARALLRLQPRAGGGDRARDPLQPPRFPAARKGGARDGLSRHRHRKDRRSARDGSLGLAHAEAPRFLRRRSRCILSERASRARHASAPELAPRVACTSSTQIARAAAPPRRRARSR